MPTPLAVNPPSSCLLACEANKNSCKHNPTSLASHSSSHTKADPCVSTVALSLLNHSSMHAVIIKLHVAHAWLQTNMYCGAWSNFQDSALPNYTKLPKHSNDKLISILLILPPCITYHDVALTCTHHVFCIK